MRFGFVGPAYTSQSVASDCQELINWYLERDESGLGKSDWQFLPAPGTVNFATLTSPTRGGCAINGRMFAVGATEFCELDAAGVKTVRGTVENDGTLCVFAIGITQIVFCSAGHLYCFTLATNVLAEVNTTDGSALQGSVSQVRFDDGYFIALLKDSSKFQLSGLLDGTSWDPLDIAQISVFPGNVPAFFVDHREAIVLGEVATVVYADTGNPFFPFEVIPGGFVEQGIIAALSVVKADNSTLWLGGSERGAGIAWRLQGYLPVRISTHAQETEWATYSTISDAVGYSYEDQGHIFWVLYFPSANRTWVYDTATGMWHKRLHWEAGAWSAHRSWWHVYCFGKHLVGDWNSGAVYQMSTPVAVGSTWTFCDDAGSIPIRRLRRSPYVNVERERIHIPGFEVDAEFGLGPTPALTDGNGNPRAPQMFLSWSDDNGHSFPITLTRDCGQGGEYSKRVRWLKLGSTRGRVFELSCTDPVPWRITDAYIPPATERLAAQLRKGA